MNELGRDGWELVQQSFASGELFPGRWAQYGGTFKRELADDNSTAWMACSHRLIVSRGSLKPTSPSTPAALEAPDLFAQDVTAFFRSLGEQPVEVDDAFEVAVVVGPDVLLTTGRGREAGR
jgi:hypothetical protein